MLESDPYNNGVGLQPFSICSRPLITVAEQDAFNDSLREKWDQRAFSSGAAAFRDRPRDGSSGTFAAYGCRIFASDLFCLVLSLLVITFNASTIILLYTSLCPKQYFWLSL